MGLFTSLAEQSFTTDAAHRRLFNRSYIIPDTETEIRIKQKVVWWYRSLWVVGVLYFAALPNIASILGAVMLGVFLLLGLLLFLVFHISTAADVKHLARLPEKVNYHPAIGPWASYFFLLLSVGYVFAGLWKFATGDSEGDGYFCLCGGVAVGAVVLGISWWRRSRSAAAA
jgi:hypothetical protein